MDLYLCLDGNVGVEGDYLQDVGVAFSAPLHMS